MLAQAARAAGRSGIKHNLVWLTRRGRSGHERSSNLRAILGHHGCRSADPVFEFLMVIDTLIGLLKDSRVTALVFAGAIGGFLFRKLRPRRPDSAIQ